MSKQIKYWYGVQVVVPDLTVDWHVGLVVNWLETLTAKPEVVGSIPTQ